MLECHSFFGVKCQICRAIFEEKKTTDEYFWPEWLPTPTPEPTHRPSLPDQGHLIMRKGRRYSQRPRRFAKTIPRAHPGQTD